jgi:ubiquinone/menaquinone biosynthesis C-methylase UbiE
MAAQLVGDKGQVIGVDMTDEMLALARRHQNEMAEKLGGDRVSFRKGYIQDLALNVEAMENYLAANPMSPDADSSRLNEWKEQQRHERPLVESDSVDLVVSNCVLNLVAESDRTQMISEIFRVLRPGGRVAISDIVSDEIVPQHLQEDDELWSGCISGAFQELQFAQSFLDAGFVLVSYDKWDDQPWQVVEGIEFRSVTLMALKPSPESCLDIGQAVIYKGPYSEVRDDENNIYRRGVRIAVCESTYKSITEGPLKDDFIGIDPESPKPAVKFCAAPGTTRPASETKGGEHSSSSSSSCC